MSHAGAYFKTGKALLTRFEEGKPHTSVTDWIEVLSSDRYDELSLDGIPELVESVNIQGSSGTQEASRAIRKKLKYGNVHRQLRALVILRALTENASKGFQLNWADEMLMDRLKTMAQDSLLDPKVKKRLIFVFHAWSIQYADETRMRAVANLYSQHSGAPSRRGSTAPSAYTSASGGGGGGGGTRTSAPARSSTFTDTDTLYSHSWAPAPGQRGADTYADLAQAKADAEARRATRDRQIALEQREAELERREREGRRRQDMAALEARRQKDMEEEQERRRKMKEQQKRGGAGGAGVQQKQQKRFDLQKEKPNIMVAVASALQSANVLVNSMRHINREYENVQESPKVQENLDKAKAARRTVIKYIQVVQDEELVGTLLEANEKVVEAIQMYDKMSKPAVLDSDSDGEGHGKNANAPALPASDMSGGRGVGAGSNTEREIDALTRRMEAQRLEAMRTGELQKMQDRQKRESAREKQRRAEGRPTRYEEQYHGRGGMHPDLTDLDFGSSPPVQQSGRGLPPPMTPDSERGSFDQGTLSDFSDDGGDYDSSDSEYRASHSRRPSHSQGYSSGYGKQGSSSRRASMNQAQGQGQSSRSQPQSPRGPSGPGTGQGRRPQQPLQNQYASLKDDDPFADDMDTPVQENRRMQWTEI